MASFAIYPLFGGGFGYKAGPIMGVLTPMQVQVMHQQAAQRLRDHWNQQYPKVYEMARQMRYFVPGRVKFPGY